MTGDDSFDDQIRAEQIGRLLRYLPTQYLGGIVVITLFIAFFSGTGIGSDTVILSWVGFVVAVYVGGFIFLAFLRATPRSSVLWAPFALGYGVGGGAVWGVAAALFFDPTHTESVMFLLPALIGLAAVGVSGLISYLPSVGVFWVSLMGPLAAVLIRAGWESGANIYWILVALVAVCGAGFGTVAYLSNRNLIQAWRYRLELQASETRFRDFAESASEWFWETDSQHRISYLSSQAVAVREKRTGDVIGRTREEIAAEDRSAHPEHWRPYQMAMAELQPFRDFVYPIRLGDGSRAQVVINGIPAFDEAGRFLGYRGTGRDITRDIEVRDGLKAAQRQLLAAVEAYPGAFFLFDSDERLVLFNSRALEWYSDIEHLLVPGTSLEAITRAYVDIYLADSDIDTTDRVRRRLDQFRRPGEAQVHHLKDGRHTLVQETRTNDGGTVSVRMDISSLVNAQLSAAQANRSKSEFLANMSHELRTPLNAIIGFADAMRHGVIGPIENKTYSDYIEHIHHSGQHLLSLISDILDVSAVEAGRIQLNEANLDIELLLGQCLALVRGRAEERRVKLSVAIADGIPALRADERRVKQVLINLLGNAVKFTQPGGGVEAVAAVNNAGEMVLAVKDNGPGLAPEEIAVAFSPFGRTQSAIESAQEGTGLGLPLSKSLIEAHGGRLTIDSVKGEGCTVSAIFPADRVINPFGPEGA